MTTIHGAGFTTYKLYGFTLYTFNNEHGAVSMLHHNLTGTFHVAWLHQSMALCLGWFYGGKAKVMVTI